MEERWGVFPEDDRFLISDKGRVRGVRGRIHATQPDKDGYRKFTCWRYYGSAELRDYRTFSVHRAVIMTFVGPIPKGMVINHKNGIKDDNRLENLEVVSHSENSYHSYSQLGRKAVNTNPSKGEKHHNSSLTAADVIEIRRLYAAGARQVDLAEKFSTPQTNISQIVRRAAWKHVA